MATATPASRPQSDDIATPGGRHREARRRSRRRLGYLACLIAPLGVAGSFVDAGARVPPGPALTARGRASTGAQPDRGPLPEGLAFRRGKRTYVVRDGAAVHELPGRQYGVLGWSPDGGWLLRSRLSPRATVLLRAGGGVPPRAFPRLLTHGAPWSPDGTRFTGQIGRELVVAGLGGATVSLATLPA